MIDNVEKRIRYCIERLHWAESENEIEQLKEEIRILTIVSFAMSWDSVCDI